jgi:hypothetical protein
MPLKSKAQIRKWGELVKEGKISEDKFKEALSGTSKNIPERLTPKKQKITSVQQLRELGKKR